MSYKRVYAPSGEPFDVPEARANDLILNQGWTQTAPVFEAKAEPAEDSRMPRRNKRKKDNETPDTLNETDSNE